MSLYRVVCRGEGLGRANANQPVGEARNSVPKGILEAVQCR
jgi:hypothetical protein